MITVDEVVELEIAVWHALQSGDSEADMKLLSEDFLGVYPTGFADRADHAGQLINGPTVEDFTICEPRLLTLSESHVLLAYRAEFRRAESNGELDEMFVSSLWSLRDDRWENVFSQDTPKV